MKDLFGNCQSEYQNFTAFQDEAGCKDSNFFYHGFLFINNQFGANILNNLIKIKKVNKKRYTEISFKKIRAASSEKEGYKARIALEWLNLSRQWLIDKKIRFYIIGINKNNLGNFWNNNWRYDKNIYLRFFEMGLKGSIKWFGNDKKLMKPLVVSHLFYEYGNYNDERKDKIKWLSKLFFGEILNHNNAQAIFSDEKRQKLMDPRLSNFSNLAQLNDLLLGVCKYSFIKLNPKHKGRIECIKFFSDVVEKFSNRKVAFNPKSNFYKSFCLNFFPKNKIDKKDFFGKTTNYYIKSDKNFYCDRLTYEQEKAKEMQRYFIF